MKYEVAKVKLIQFSNGAFVTCQDGSEDSSPEQIHPSNGSPVSYADYNTKDWNS